MGAALGSGQWWWQRQRWGTNPSNAQFWQGGCGQQHAHCLTVHSAIVKQKKLGENATDEIKRNMGHCIMHATHWALGLCPLGQDTVAIACCLRTKFCSSLPCAWAACFIVCLIAVPKTCLQAPEKNVLQLCEANHQGEKKIACFDVPWLQKATICW